VSFLPKIKIEVAVASDQVDKTIDRHHISGKNRTDRRRQDLRHQPRPCVRIRTGEADCRGTLISRSTFSNQE